VDLTKTLDDAGLDAGARTIHYHLRQAHDDVPAVSTIHRVRRRRDLVVDQPQKRSHKQLAETIWRLLCRIRAPLSWAPQCWFL